MCSMKPKKDKNRWYTAPIDENPTDEAGEVKPSKYAARLMAKAEFELGGNSVEERLQRIQFLVYRIHKNVSLFVTVALVIMVYAFIVVLSNV